MVISSHGYEYLRGYQGSAKTVATPTVVYSYLPDHIKAAKPSVISFVGNGAIQVGTKAF